MEEITYQEIVPGVEEYLALREAVDFSVRSPESARLGLPGSAWAVTARNTAGEAVGMARLVGDGGLAYVVADVIVLPEYQKMGIGSEMMRRLDDWADTHLPATAMVCLLADEPGRKLYERQGYAFTAPHSLGMKRFVPRSSSTG